MGLVNPSSGASPPLLIPVQAVAPADIDPRTRISLASVFAAQQRGSDPTAAWRRVVHHRHRAEYAAAPLRVAVTFVAQWVLQSLACAVVFADRAGLHLRAPESLWIDIDAEAGYPRHVLILAEHLIPSPCPDPAASYAAAASEFVGAYRPGIPMSSRQRAGLVTDVWQAATVPVVPGSSLPRVSCCFIYALPGMKVCGGCPRVLAPRANRSGRSPRLWNSRGETHVEPSNDS